jgi:CubicO group peptidase (beta-lactamase class C family)
VIQFGSGVNLLDKTRTALDAVPLAAFEYMWGGAASTIFWGDPVEDLTVVFMTQLLPSGTFNFRGQLKTLVYPALTD